MELEEISNLSETETEVIKVLASRWRKGRKEYCYGVDYKEYDSAVWVDQAIEEAADMLIYLCALRLKMIENGMRDRKVFG